MAEETKKEDKTMAPACAGCLRWEQFGRNCFYYWDLKKECSMKALGPDQL